MFNRALIIFFLFECIFAQATSVLPIGRADGTHNSSGIPDGYYNINARDSNSGNGGFRLAHSSFCLLYTSPSPRDQRGSGVAGWG